MAVDGSQRIDKWLVLAPGVVFVPGTGANQLSIRGGRPDENATYIDGVPISSGTRGNYSVSAASTVRIASTEATVGPGGFEEASVTTGSSSAEFGNAQSGIVNIVTKTGGNEYTGSVSYESDEPFGKMHGLGYNRAEASISGPIPGMDTASLPPSTPGSNVLLEITAT